MKFLLEIVRNSVDIKIRKLKNVHVRFLGRNVYFNEIKKKYLLLQGSACLQLKASSMCSNLMWYLVVYE